MRRSSLVVFRRSALVLALAFSMRAGATILMAQQIDETLGYLPTAPDSNPSGFVAPAGPIMILDDFNRPDGPIGANWTDQEGSFSVVGNAARGGTLALATYNGGFGDTVEGDIQVNGTTLQYVALVLNYGGGTSNIFVKAQAQSGAGFDNAGCYLGNNSSGGVFGLGFFALDAPFDSAHMRITVDASRDVTLEFTNIDGGGGSQSYLCTAAPPAEGPDIGIGAFTNAAQIDNFAGNAMIPVELLEFEVD